MLRSALVACLFLILAACAPAASETPCGTWTVEVGGETIAAPQGDARGCTADLVELLAGSAARGQLKSIYLGQANFLDGSIFPACELLSSLAEDGEWDEASATPSVGAPLEQVLLNVGVVEELEAALAEANLRIAGYELEVVRASEEAEASAAIDACEARPDQLPLGALTRIMVEPR